MIIHELSIFVAFGGKKLWKYAKYIENQGVNNGQYCFASISTMKAWIFMKF